MNKINTASRILLFVLAQFCTLNFAFAQNECLKIGQNVTNLEFKDVFKQCYGWRYPESSPGNVLPGAEQPYIDALPKDVNGYPNAGIPYTFTNLKTGLNTQYTGPLTSVKTFSVRESFTPYAIGEYYFFWQGQGTIESTWNGNPNIVITAGSYGTIPVGNGYGLESGVANTGITAISTNSITSDNSPGVHYCRISVTTTSGGTVGRPSADPYNNYYGIETKIVGSAVAPNHIRGISIVQPDFGSNAGGYNGGSKVIADGGTGSNARNFVESTDPEFFKNQPFTPAFLNWIKVAPVIRFKDVIGVDGETPNDISWLNVRPYDYYTQSAQVPGIGHPVNYMYIIQLCNMLKISPWINGFVNSDENYQRTLGRLFRDNLDPSLKVYLELSNENTWNFYPGFNGPGLISNYAFNNGLNNIDAAALLENRFWVNFGSSWNAADQDRMVRVVAGQAVNAYHCLRKAQWHEAKGERYDVLSLAWYLDQLQTNGRNVLQTDPPSTLLGAMLKDNNFNRNQDSYTDYPSIAKQLDSHTKLARSRGKKVVLYEGGTHHSFAQNGRENWHRSKFIKWLPEIRTFYRSLLDTIRSFPEIELALSFNHFGGNDTLSGTSFTVNDQTFGYVPSMYVDTTASGNKSYSGLEFGSINILGANAHGVWKELYAQNQRWKNTFDCNPTVTSDIVGAGLSLTFSSIKRQYLTVSGVSLIDPLSTPNYTLETWVQPQELERNQTIWAYSNGTAVINSLQLNSLNRFVWNIGNGNTILTGPVVNRDKWYHVAVVKNGSSVSLYLNGTLVASASVSGSIGIPTNFTIGASNTGTTTDFFRGKLDEFRVWNFSANSQPIIRDFMCKKLNATHPNFVALDAYYEFNSIAGPNLLDKISGVSEGKLINYEPNQGVFSYGYLPSGAPIGDLSTNIYPGSWTNTALSYTNPTGGDIINVNGLGVGNPDGVHIYVINQAPTLNTKPQFYQTIAGKYFGVFVANGTDPLYNVNYSYQGNPSASATIGFNRLVKRDAGSDYSWENSGARIDALNRTLITNCTESYRAEYILGVRLNQLIQRPGAGSCISLSGTSIGTFNNFNRSDVYTISLWAKNSVTTNAGVLGFKNDFLNSEIGYSPTTRNGFVARLNTQSLGNQNSIYGGANESWSHYAYTRDASGLVVFYVNGYPSTSINFPGDTAMVDLMIGLAQGGNNYIGQIDELSVWKRNLTLTEIRDLMCKKITPAHPSYCDLYAYFRFDEASGNVMENTLGAGNLVFNGPIGWARSGAALGDESKHNYNAPYVATLSYPEGDFIRVTPTVQQTMVGTQVYYVNGDPNYPIYPSTESYPVAIPNRDTSRYFGTYVIPYNPEADGNNSRSYLYEYNYGSNKNINFTNEASLRLIRRENNQILNWTNTGINPVIASKTLTFQSPVRTDAHYPVGEFLLAGISPSPFIAPLNGIPTILGITGKLTMCLGESNSIYKVLATVDKRALSFKWIASNGLTLSNSTTDSVSVTALTAGTHTLTVIGINKYGTSTPAVYTINVQNSGYQSANITGNINPCNSTSSTYNITGVSPAPTAYIWSVTGDAINPTPSNITSSNTFNFGSGGQSTVRISVYGQYSCGLALINTLNVNNNSLPSTSLAVVGDSICQTNGLNTIDVAVFGSQFGTTYTAYDGSTPVATTSGNGAIMYLNIPTSILTPLVNKTIRIRAQNNLCPLIPVTLSGIASVFMGNTLSGADLTPTFSNPGNVCYDATTNSVSNFNLSLSGVRAGITYTPIYFTFAQPYGEPFEYVVGNAVLATSTSIQLQVAPSTFPFWLSSNFPNTIGGYAKAPGCPTQKLTTRTSFLLLDQPPVAVPSKVAGVGKGSRVEGDIDYEVCTGSATSYYTTAKGGNVDQFNKRRFAASFTNGGTTMTLSAFSNMGMGDLANNDIVYVIGSQTDGYGGPVDSFGQSLSTNVPRPALADGTRIPYFVRNINVGANTIQLSATRGGAAINFNYSTSMGGVKFWAPVQVDIPANTNTITIPNRFGTLGLSLHSQVELVSAETAPAGVCIGAVGDPKCTGIYYVASINGTGDIQLSSNPNLPTLSQGYYQNRGFITYNTGSTVVTGYGTMFESELLQDINDGRGGAILRDMSDNFIGEVLSVTSQGSLVLKANAAGNAATRVKFSSTKRARFASAGRNVILSTPATASSTGFEWTVTPLEAVVNVTATGGGGSFNAATGVFTGGVTDANGKNGITVVWNGTYSGTAFVEVTSSNNASCDSKSSREFLPNVGYEQTRVSLQMQSQVPGNPNPISFTDLSFCQSQSTTNFVTNAQNAVGGFQWQLQNAGSSYIVPVGNPCMWSRVSTVVGAKGTVSVSGMTENVAPCLNTDQLYDSPAGSTTASVEWQPGFTGQATIRVRSLGCGSMSTIGDMRASPWVTAVITVGGAPPVGNINLSGQLQLCQGASPTQQYIASGTNIDAFRYFLRKPGQVGDIDLGLIAYYPFDGDYQNLAIGFSSLGAAVNATNAGTTNANNKSGTTTSAITFAAANRVNIPINTAFDLSTPDPLPVTGKTLSFSFWARYQASGGTPQNLFAFNDNYGYPANYGFNLVGASASNLRLAFYGYLSGNSATGGTNNALVCDRCPVAFETAAEYVRPTTITGSVAANTWNHFSINMKLNNGRFEVRGYLNGVFAGLYTITTTSTLANKIFNDLGANKRFSIGGGADDGSSSFNGFVGDIDEFMIHDRELSAADIAYLYSLDAKKYIDPTDYIGEINPNTGLATWQTTFTGAAQIAVQAIGCGGSTIKLYDAFISPKPSILGISIADPTGCGNPLASGSITITLASFNPSTFTGSPWAISWNNDLISDGTGTLSGSNTVTLNTGLFAGSSITGISTWYNGSAGCNAPISITSRIIVGSTLPSSLIGTSLMSLPQVCTASTSSGINVLGSENNVRYYAMIGSIMVSPTVVGTGGNIQLSITGANILTATGLNQVHQIKTLAFSPGCSLVTLSGIQSITVNGLSASNSPIVSGTNPICNPATSVVSVGGVNGTIDWQVSTGAAFASTGGNVANYTTPSLTQTSTFRALVTNGACPAVTTSSAVVTVNSPVTTTFAYNQPAYCNNLTTVVSPVLSNTVAGGVFTVAPTGLTLNATSGAATINSSSAALYTVTYSYTVPGCPALTTTTTMRIGSIPGLAFGFVPTVFCTSSGNQTPGTTFTGLGSGGTFSSTSAGLVFVSTTSGQVNIAGSTAGTYPLIYTVSVVGCGNVTSTVGNAITINSIIGTSISYTGTPYCNNVASANVVAVNTVSGGIYTSAPAGLTINSANGTITPTSSTQGTYTVTYSYTIPGCGALTTTTTLVINSIPGILFNYPNSPFCKNGTNPTASTTIGGSGGTFSSAPAGLSFTNATLGTVDLTASTANTYNITYTISVAGCGNVTSTVGNAITINSVPGTSISYTGTPYCNNVASANVLAVNTVSGGIYTSAPAGLTINSANGTITPTSSTQGTYTVTYSYTIPGCGPQTTTTSLTINSVPGILFNYGTVAYCKNGTNPSANTTIGGSGGTFTSAPAGLSFTNSVLGTVNLAASTANIYNITYTISIAGCGNVSSTVGSALTISGVPTITGTTKTDMTNCGVLDGTVTINGIGNNGMALQYQYGAVAFQSVNLFAGLGAGTYTPSIRYASLLGCSATGATFSISAPNTPSLNTAIKSDITNCGLSDGRVTISGTGGTLPYDFSLNGSIWSVTGTVGTFSGLSSGSYNAYIRNSASPACSVSGIGFFNITIPSAPTLVTISGTAPSTCVATDGSATITGTFGSTTPEYSINGSTWFASNVFTGLGVGTRTAYMRNVGGSCSVTGGSTTLNAPFPRPNFSYGAGPFCNNSAITTVSSSNFTVGGFFNASGITVNATNGTISAGAPQGSYTVTYTIPGSGFCTGISTTAGVTINSVPGILFSYTGSPFCKNGGTSSAPSATIGGVGGSYSGTAGLVFANTTTGTIDLNASTAGTYNVTYTISIAGCGNVSSTVGSALTINSVPGVSISYVSPVCNTATISGVTAINTVSGGTYSATGGLTINPTNGTVNPSGFGGTYTITYSYTIAGCGPQSTTTSLVVTTLPSTPVLSYGTNPICSSNSPISLVSSTNAINGSFLTSATGFINVNASTGQITIPQNTLAGVFVVRYDIPAGAGCASVTGNNTITLSGVPNALSITNIPATQCYNAQVVLNATGTIPGASIQWLQDGVAVGTNSAVYTTTGLTNASYTYVAVLNNGVCTTVPSAPMVVNVNVNPTVTGISSSQSFACSSQSVTFNNTGLVGSIVYAVNTGAGFNVLPSNIYTFTNTIVGNAFSFVGYAFVAGCQTVNSAPIIVNSSLCGLTAAFGSNPTPICLTNATSTGVTFTNNSTSAGGTILGYAWNFGAGATPPSTVIGINSTNYTIPVTYSTAGSKNITLSIIGTGGLTSTISGTVQVDAPSTISAMSIPVAAICETNNIVNLSVTALGNIQWYKTGAAQGTVNVQAAGAMTSNTTFIATAVNGVCPMVTATGVVTVTNLNVGGLISGATALCASSSGLNLTVTGQVGNSYTWYNSTNSGTTWNTLSSNVTSIATGTLSTTTSYVVSVSGGACPNVASNIANINVTPTPIAGTASVDRMIVCTSDGNGGIYSLSSSSGSIQWERSLDSSSWSNAAGAGNTTASFTANTELIIGAKYFRAKVTNGGACGNVYSNVITVTASSCGLQAAFTPNLTTVCVSVGNTVRFTDASTSTNTILGYTWDFGGGTGGNVNTAGPHDITFTSIGPKNIRLTILGLGGLTSIATGTVQVDATSLQGSISTGLLAPICYNNSATLTLTGSLGNIQWYSTTTGSLGNTSTLGTGNLTAGDGYFATVKNGVCPMLTTSGVSVAVHPQSNAGTISSNAASVCQNLTATLGVTGNTGTIYQWQEWNGSAFVNIPNATTSGFTTASLTNTISGTYQYRLEVKSGVNACTPAYSNTVTVDAIVCSLAANVTVNGSVLPTAISLQNASGTGLNFGIQLLSGTVVGYNWSLVGAGTTSSAASTVNTGYASSGVYNVLVTVIGIGNVPFPFATVVTIDGMSQPGTISGANPICYNTTANLNLSGSLGNIQWYNSSGIISGANVATFTTPNLTANETYFATVKNGVSPMVTAAGFTVNVRPEATVTSINAQSGTICIGTAVTIAGIETGNNTIVGWQISTDNEVTWSPTAFTNSIINIASASSNPRESYRPLVQNGAGCSIVTVSGFATINPIGCTATVSFTGHPLATECLSNASTVGYNMIDATTSLAPKLAWSWNFGSGSSPATATTSAPGIVTYNTSGPKQIRLTVTIAGGNVFTTTVPGLGDFTLDALPDASTINSNSTALCSGNSLNLSISGVPTATTYAWERSTTNTFVSTTSLGVSTTTVESMPNPTGTSSDYFYRLGVTNGACTVTGYSNVITVSSTLQPSASINYTLDNCKGNPGMTNVTVTVNTLGGGSFPYTFSSGTLNNTVLDGNTGLINTTNAPTGSHVVTLTSSAFKGCNAFSTTASMNINQNPTASFSYPNAAYCENFGLVNTSASVLTANGTFFSNGLSINNSTIGTFSTIGQTTGTTYTIQYAIPATAGCPAQTVGGASMTINANPVVIAPTYTNGLTYCNVGNTGGLSNANTVAGLYVSTPSLGSNLNASTGVINLVGLTAQNYAISYSTTGTNTCASIQSTATGITVNQNPSSTTFSYTNSNICAPNVTGPANVGISGGIFTLSANAINDNLSINNGSISSSASNASVGTTRNYTITYTLTVNGFGCLPANATTTISVSKQYPSIPFGYSTSARGAGGEMCAEGIATVTTTGLTGGVFRISPISGNIDANTGRVDLSKLNLGQYTVTYSIPGLSVCPAVTSSAIINTTSSGRADIVQANSGTCQDQIKTFDTDPKLYDNRSDIVWTESINNGVSNTLSSTSKELFNHTLVGAGLHTIKVSVKNGGCTEVTDFVDIRVDAYPEAGVINTIISGDTLLCYEPNTGLTITGFRGDNFIWEYSKKEVKKDKSIAFEDYKEFLAYNSKLPVATSPSFISNEDFTSKFYIRAKVYNGACTLGPDGKDVYTPVLIVSKCPQLDFIPNALTPGSGNENSFWDIQKLRLPENSIVTIFNRYGVEVYTMTGKDLQTRSFDGDGLPAGTYYYLIDYKSSEKAPVRGDLTIIR